MVAEQLFELLINNSDDNFIFGTLAKTLNEILITTNVQKNWLLFVDVEGSEIEVLKGIKHSIFCFIYKYVEFDSKDSLFYYS